MNQILTRIAESVYNNQNFVVLTRKKFEQFKGEITDLKQYVTHFAYRRGDMVYTCVCLKKGETK